MVGKRRIFLLKEFAMKKFFIVVLLLQSARAELLQLDLSIFGMD